jgi:uncharacterized membrane protein
MAVASLGVLIYFIHHVSVSILADEIVARVASDLMSGIERLFPTGVGEGVRQTVEHASLFPSESDFEQGASPIACEFDGYVQFVDATGLLSLASQSDVIIRLERIPGRYVLKGTPLVLVFPGDRIDEKFAAQVNGKFAFGNERTPSQDLEYAVEQLVEIAVRALSPGINDPFTASTCVDRLGSALARLAQREFPSPLRCDSDGKPRLIATSITFCGVVDAAFNQIRQYARTSASVTIRLLETIRMVGSVSTRLQDRETLRRHADMVVRSGRESLLERDDREVVDDRYKAACLQLDSGPTPKILPPEATP